MELYAKQAIASENCRIHIAPQNSSDNLMSVSDKWSTVDIYTGGDIWHIY